MRCALDIAIACICAQTAPVSAAPVVSNVRAAIVSITDNGKGLKTRSFEVTFDLTNTNGKTCRIFPGVRGVERNPVLPDEGPYLWYKGLTGDTAATAGVNRTVRFEVVDTAGEFDMVRVKVTAWDRDGWPPWPNRTFNPRYHAWALDVRGGAVHAKSDSLIARLRATAPALLQVVFDFTVFRVMGGHQRAIPAITDYPDESDHVAVPFPHTSLGDPYNAYPEGEGNFATGTCTNDGDCHIEIVDVENWISWSMGRCFKTGSGAFQWNVGEIAQFPLYSEVFTEIGTGPIPGGTPAAVGAYRDITWTSGDAAGLDIVPGLVLLDEIDEGEIQHALRSCSKGSAPYFVHPASHRAGALSDPYAAPMGLRWRLKSSFNINQEIPLTGAPGTAAYRDARAARIILRACQKYGVINADNSGWSAGYLMAELDNHHTLKWANLCANNSVSKYLQSAGISFDDFEIVDWNWQYQQYVKYQAKK
jgi:hypothetical protein